MKRFLLSSFLLCIFFSTYAREISFTPYADNLFTDESYDEVIKNQCRKIADENGVTSLHFESNYHHLRDSILLLAHDLIVKKFVETEARITKQNVKNKIASQLFEKALSNAISVTLSQNRGLRSALLKKDLNDRIISYDSKIKIDTSGLIDVTETIVVANFNDESLNSNNTIKRGITRDFPTRYSTSAGLITEVPFKLLSVTRNGEKENFRSENISNGYRIYCGRSDYFLENGLHKYVLHYTTAKQIKFHNNRDEFYWNVTGNGWSFSIDKAACEIEFPEGAVTSDLNCYTGAQGSKDRHCHSETFARNSAQFYSQKRLEPYEGLTVSVSINKGIIKAENQAQLLLNLVNDNKFLIGIFLFVVLMFIILFRYWFKVGKDPKQGIIIPEFAPPEGLSPADVGYIYHQAYNNKLLTAALIDLAVHKKLHIEVEREGLIFKSNVYKFSAPAQHQSGRDYDLYKKYGFDAEDLFGIEIEKGKYNARFASINTSFKNHIDAQILTDKSGSKSKGFLSMNQGYIGLGFFLMFACSLGSIIYMSIFPPPMQTMIYAGVIMLIGFIILFIFMKIMKAYSAEGRIMADRILGFRMYLGTTEKNILNNLNPPEENIQLFEKYLPYAIALEIENKWSEKFKTIIEQSLEGGYKPSYYSMGNSSNFSGHSSSFASALSSGLSSTASSASTPPSSSGSSGSGGGGSSGGGGGGGGGGGW